jgi:hypothetical protein
MPMYARGSIAWGLCQRCGLRFLLDELIFDGYYPNLRVCTGCYDPPQPQERLAIVSDPVALYRPAPDAMYISPPVLTVTVSGSSANLAWEGFNLIPERISDQIGGKRPRGGSSGANITAGYIVYRSADGLTWTQVAQLPNTADEWGALVVETLNYTDTPPMGGFWYYKVLGYDVLFNAEYG